jgi:chromosome partitioning protein
MEKSELLGIAEIAELAEVSKQTVNNWRVRYDSFPKPVQSLQSGPIWLKEKIEDWVNSFKDDRTHVISIINLKGGVAKTTSAVAIAEMLAQQHRKHVLLIDLDPQTNATLALIPEEQWTELDQEGKTVAQLFEDRIKSEQPPKFKIEQAIVKNVSTINNGIARLDLLASSIRLIDLQDKIPFIAMAGNYKNNPLEILRVALLPVMERYDYIIIDCPPSLGTITKNGLRISTGYIIPTIPDIVSTWGIYQIVDNIKSFGDDIGKEIPALGIVATKVQTNNLYASTIRDLKNRQLGKFGDSSASLEQPRLFENTIPQTVAVARGADVESDIRTFKGKYGVACQAYEGLTEEILELCEAKKY